MFCSISSLVSNRNKMDGIYKETVDDIEHMKWSKGPLKHYIYIWSLSVRMWIVYWKNQIQWNETLIRVLGKSYKWQGEYWLLKSLFFHTIYIESCCVIPENISKKLRSVIFFLEQQAWLAEKKNAY